MSKSIAFFDFDGTITTKDTMLELVKFAKGKKVYLLGMLQLLPWLIGLKAGIINNTVVKERFLKKFFKGVDIKAFEKVCDAFVTQKLPQLIRPGALQKIEEFQLEGIPVVVVSASADNWIKGWCTQHNITCIGSCLDVKNGKLTGKLNGPNCHSAEKVNRIKALYHLADYDAIYCFGDTQGDKPMLQLATHAYYKPFR